jgi:hypothetical protein
MHTRTFTVRIYHDYVVEAKTAEDAIEIALETFNGSSPPDFKIEVRA